MLRTLNVTFFLVFFVILSFRAGADDIVPGEILRPSFSLDSVTACPGLNFLFPRQGLTAEKRKVHECDVRRDKFLQGVNGQKFRLVTFAYKVDEPGIDSPGLPHVDPFTSECETTLLLEELSTGKFRAVWRYVVNGDPSATINGGKLIQVDGRNILELQVFSGGTAGYWQEFFEFTPLGPQYLRSDALSNCFPQTYSRKHFVRFDLPNKKAVMKLRAKDEQRHDYWGEIEYELQIGNHGIIDTKCTFKKATQIMP